MANLALDAEFGIDAQTSCGQIEAERNHDFKTFKDPHKHDVLNALQSPACDDFAEPPLHGADEGHPRWTDKSFVRYIFNTNNATTSKFDVENRGIQTHTTQYRGQTNYGGTNPAGQALQGGQALFNGSIRTFNNNITGILNHLTAIYGPNSNLYLFVDTGHNLLKKFSEVPQGSVPNSVHLNIINSQAKKQLTL